MCPSFRLHLPSFHFSSFISSSPLFFCRPPTSVCQSCLQPCIISWTELLQVWSRSGSGSTRLITENTPVSPASSSFSSSASLYSRGLYGVSVGNQMVKRHNQVSLESKTETGRHQLCSRQNWDCRFSDFCPIYDTDVGLLKKTKMFTAAQPSWY